MTIIEKIDQETGISELVKIFHSPILAEREFMTLNRPFIEWKETANRRSDIIKKYQDENGFTEKWRKGNEMWRTICEDNLIDGKFSNYHEVKKKFIAEGYVMFAGEDVEWPKIASTIELPIVGQQPDEYTIREFPCED